MDTKDRKNINKAVLMWAVAALLLLILATPALSTIFASPGSVNTKAIVNGAVKTKKIAAGAVKSAKIANGAVDSAKIADGSIVNADIAAGAAIAASKINRTGLDADLLDGKDSGDFVAKTGDQVMAGNLTAGNVAYGSAKTGYLNISGAALQPSDDNVRFNRSNNWIYADSPAGEIRFTAPVNLPQGATVTEVRAKVYDGELWPTFDITISLDRYTSTAHNSSMSSRSTSGSAGWLNVNNSLIVDPVIDNSIYNYAILAKTRGEAGPSHKISLITVVYTYTNAGD